MSIELVPTDSQEIYDSVIGSLQDSVGGPLYPGDERRMFGEAIVAVLVSAFNSLNEAARQKMLAYARGDVLDALGERTLTYRLKSTPAICTLRFSVPSPATTGVVIPAKTKVTGDGIVYFETDKTAVISSGEISVDIGATATVGGSAGNEFEPGIIQTIVNGIPHVSAVTNLDQTHSGTDGEPYTEEGDTKYRERIRLSAARFSTAGPIESYKYWALTADPSIETVAVLSPEAGEVVIVPLLAGGELPGEDVLESVQRVCSADDVRPMTDKVTVTSPKVEPYNIEITYYTTVADEAKCIEAIEGDDGAVRRYIVAQSKSLGLDINPDLLRRYVLSPDWENGLVGALRVDVIEPEHKVLDETTIAQFSGDITINHEVVTS